MDIVAKILSLSGIGIGSYMTFTYGGSALAPTLSGLAFICLGLAQLLRNESK